MRQTWGGFSGEVQITIRLQVRRALVPVAITQRELASRSSVGLLEDIEYRRHSRQGDVPKGGPS